MTRSHDPDRHAPTAFRRLFDASVLFFCAVLLVRSIAVEPFGVPTGSMAPTFIGNHVISTCPRCGFANNLGEPIDSSAEVCCSNCGHAPLPPGDQLVPGDRVLVDKLVYEFRDPKRWETAVFLRDAEPDKPFVKRVVGLPGERIFLYDGEIYIDGQLVRKSADECRDVRVLIYDQEYRPDPDGWQRRWVRERPGTDCVFGMASLKDTALLLDATTLPEGLTQWVTYCNRDLDTGQDRVIRNELGYNGACRPGRVGHPVHDFLIECGFRFEQQTGVFSCRLQDGADRVTLRLDLAAGLARLVHEPDEVVRTSIDLDLKPNTVHRLMFSFFDRRVMAELNGRPLFAAYELPMADRREAVTQPMQFGAAGAEVEVRPLRLYRDLYHTSSGRHAVERPLDLGAGEYFVLGDNSSNSDDSRWWDDPAVDRGRFLGKPFLLHQPSRLGEWSMFGETRKSRVIDWDRIRRVR